GRCTDPRARAGGDLRPRLLLRACVDRAGGRARRLPRLLPGDPRGLWHLADGPEHRDDLRQGRGLVARLVRRGLYAPPAAAHLAVPARGGRAMTRAMRRLFLSFAVLVFSTGAG